MGNRNVETFLKCILSKPFDSNCKLEMTNGREKLQENLCLSQILHLLIVINKEATMIGKL